MMQDGALPKSVLKNVIEDELIKNKTEFITRFDNVGIVAPCIKYEIFTFNPEIHFENRINCFQDMEVCLFRFHQNTFLLNNL